MKAHSLTLTEARAKDDATGRVFIRWTPVLIPALIAKGALTFAFWEAWEDEPDTHEPQKARALAGARESLRLIVAEV